MANLFNPTEATIKRTVELPLYYAGVAPGASVELTWGGSLVNPTRWQVPENSTHTVRADYSVRVELQMAPRSFPWAALRVVAPAPRGPRSTAACLQSA